MQAGQALTFCTYGDSAYVCVRDLYIQCRNTLYEHDPLEVRQRAHLENLSLSSCREVIEWDYVMIIIGLIVIINLKYVIMILETMTGNK